MPIKQVNTITTPVNINSPFYKFAHLPTPVDVFGGDRNNINIKYPPKFVWGEGDSPIFDIAYSDPIISDDIFIRTPEFPNMPIVVPGMAISTWGYIINESSLRLSNALKDIQNYIDNTNIIDKKFKLELENIIIKINKDVYFNADIFIEQKQKVQIQITALYKNMIDRISIINANLDVNANKFINEQISMILTILDKMNSKYEHIDQNGLKLILDYGKLDLIGTEDKVGTIEHALRDHVITNRHIKPGTIDPSRLNYQTIRYSPDKQMYIITWLNEDEDDVTIPALLHTHDLFTTNDIRNPISDELKWEAVINYTRATMLSGKAGKKSLTTQTLIGQDYNNLTTRLIGKIQLAEDYNINNGDNDNEILVNMIDGNGFTISKIGNNSYAEDIVLKNTEDFTMRDVVFHSNSNVTLHTQRARMDNIKAQNLLKFIIKDTSYITYVNAMNLEINLTLIESEAMVTFDNLKIINHLSIKMPENDDTIVVLSINTAMYNSISIEYKGINFDSRSDTNFMIKCMSALTDNHILALTNVRELATR